ncbi:MAG TPA: hypothetical protein VGM53_17980 [Streptosporangiaceae bacterium]
MPSHDGDPTLADVQAAHPAWHCWRAPSGLCHARRTDAKPSDPEDETFVTSEDPLDLRDQIRRAQALTDW